MQDKYFGDIHDFYKFYFLKRITQDYPLGIHWCLHPNEPQKNEGNKSITPKEEKKDGTLYQLLLKNRHKKVDYIKSYFPKKTKYYSHELEHYYKDFIYEENSIETLKNQDIIFFDPDNGIEVSSMKNAEKYKYVSYRLLVKFWNLGKSLIVYQHERGNKGKTNEKIKILYDLINKSANIITVKKSNVTFICIIQGDKHYIIKDEIVDFLKNNEYRIESWEGTGDIIL
jgi:hypothetical protein